MRSSRTPPRGGGSAASAAPDTSLRAWPRPSVLLPLLALPFSITAMVLGLDPIYAFLGASVGLAALSAVLGSAIDSVALHTSPRNGRLLDSLLGSAAEMIIAIFALRAGLLDLVKASITGSIMANLLFFLGVAAFLGGLRHGDQYFDRERATHASTMMVLSVIALGVPAIYGQLVGERNSGPVETLSEAVAVVMILVYLFSIYYDMGWRDELKAMASTANAPTPRWPKAVSIGMIPLTLIAIAALASIFVRAVPPLIAAYPVNELFLGILVVPIVGSVAEHHVALRAAWRNRMDVAIEILTDSSTQIALLVAPLLVFCSLLLGNPMDLIFGTLELASMSAAAVVATLVAHDGKTSWLEGMMLFAVFALMSLAFFWWPA